MAHVLIIEGWISDSGNLILSILKKMGHTYTFVTRNPELYKAPEGHRVHPLFDGADQWIEVDTNNIPILIEAVKEIKFDGVITACDYYFEAVRSVAQAYDLPCPIPNNLNQIRQKHRMRYALDKAGLANAKYELAYSWQEMIESAEAIGYPLIIKPVDLGSSAFVRLVYDETELKEAYDVLNVFKENYRNQPRNPVVLLEEYLSGQEVSVECVAYDGQVEVIGVTDKSLTGAPFFIETGHMFPAEISEDKRELLTTYVTEVLKAVKFENGIAHTEVKLTSSGPVIVEINPRVPGNYIVELIEYVTGLNLLDIFVNLSLGIKPKLEREDTGIVSAASLFIVPVQEGMIMKMQGAESLKDNINIKRYYISECKERFVKKASDNACYLGHVIAVDSSGYCAREYGEIAINKVALIYDK